MKSSFAARRKPRAIARDEQDGDDTELRSEPSPISTSSKHVLLSRANIPAVSAVKRPGIRGKNPSSRQISFSTNATRTTSQPLSDDEGETFVVKKSSLSRQAIAQNAQRKAAVKLPDDRLPTRTNDESRPSYSREELALLKHSTPGTPANGPHQDDNQTLDIAAKFGSSYNHSTNGIIPSSAEIAEKKARRARLAQETQFHQDSDSDGDIELPDPETLGHDSDEDEFRKQISYVSLHDPRTKQKYPETRITHDDDEDILEGFDEFTDTPSGRINLGVGRKAERAAAAAKRQQMTEMIADAEGASSDSNDGNSGTDDDSERRRRDVYDAVQTRKAMGLDAANAARSRDEALPPKLPPLPTLGGVIEKLRGAIEGCRLMREAKQREIEDVEQERREIAEREGELKSALAETAEGYRKLVGGDGGAGSAGMNGSAGVDVNGALAVSAAQSVQRGLENLA